MVYYKQLSLRFN